MNLSRLIPGGGIRATAIAPEIYARAAEAFGFKYKDETQLLEGGIKVWSSKFLAGCCVEDSDEAFAVHLCAHSWHSPSKRERLVRGAKELVKALLGSVGLYEYVPLKEFLLYYVRKLDS